MFLKCFHCCVVHTGMMDDIMTVERNVQGAKIPMTDCIVYCLVRKVMMLSVDRNPTRGKKTENLKTESWELQNIVSGDLQCEDGSLWSGDVVENRCWNVFHVL